MRKIAAIILVCATLFLSIATPCLASPAEAVPPEETAGFLPEQEPEQGRYPARLLLDYLEEKDRVYLFDHEVCAYIQYLYQVDGNKFIASISGLDWERRQLLIYQLAYAGLRGLTYEPEENLAHGPILSYSTYYGRMEEMRLDFHMDIYRCQEQGLREVTRQGKALQEKLWEEEDQEQARQNRPFGWLFAIAGILAFGGRVFDAFKRIDQAENLLGEDNTFDQPPERY